MRLLGLYLDGRKVGNGLAQQNLNGAQLGHGQGYFAESALLQPIDQLTGADFFPDVIGMEQRFAFAHLFRLLHSTAPSSAGSSTSMPSGSPIGAWYHETSR